MKIAIAVDLALALMENSGRVSALVRQARAEGKDEVDDTKLDQVFAVDDESMVNFRQAIEIAKREGR